MRPVVAGVDLTAMGRRVADRARMMAEATGVDLSLIHVLEPFGEAMIEPGLAKLMRDHQTTEAERLAEWVRERSSVPVNLEVVKGSPSWELVATGQERRAGGGRLVVDRCLRRGAGGETGCPQDHN